MKFGIGSIRSKLAFAASVSALIAFAALAPICSSAQAQWALNPQDVVGKSVYLPKSDERICTITRVIMSPNGQPDTFECTGNRMKSAISPLNPQYLKPIIGNGGIERLESTLPKEQVDFIVAFHTKQQG